ncbi:hypothetical protein MCHIJ_50860 [Mycolicibacterium chitae]|nr:hypothetical protein MCHIJ_50860 [Mycolicibacterium chitae]
MGQYNIGDLLHLVVRSDAYAQHFAMGCQRAQGVGGYGAAHDQRARLLGSARVHRQMVTGFQDALCHRLTLVAQPDKTNSHAQTSTVPMTR